jgi:hypothetical protein
MFRKTVVVIPLFALLTACAGSGRAPVQIHRERPPAGGASPTAGTASPTPVACPTKPTRTFAKTRFVANAGLAAGAFQRYIYKPYKEGKFKANASGRKRATITAALAGLFIADQLRRARDNVRSDPSLCRVLAAPLDKLTSAVSALAERFKRGEIDEAGIAAVTGGLAGFHKTASKAGAGFTAKNVPPSQIVS